MCGIAGIFAHRGRQRVARDTVNEMLSAIEHRGPDDRGVLVDDDLVMGMQRLSIIDLAGGKQPISNEDGTVTVVFNGEIYNYRELQERLRNQGHTLRTSSDTEVVVHLYEDLGADCVNELRGMFAFAVWDSNRKRLFVARDRLGIKPLYYTECRGSLVFGSEIKALLMHPDVQPSLNVEGLGYYLSLKYVPAPQTMFSGIYALPPGHFLICDRSGIAIRQYWNLSFSKDRMIRRPEAECAEELEALLLESVHLHLASDVPFGSFLSGGVDSSLIVALMHQLMNVPVKTFSVGFEGGGTEAFSEIPYARLVARTFQTEHHEVCVTPNDIMNLSEKVVWHLDQPIADNACVATYMVSRLASQHVKMVLTGEGGDELFAGYARYAGERFSPAFSYLPASAKSLALNIAGHLPGLRRPKTALVALCQSDPLMRMANWFPLFDATRKPDLLSGEVFQQLADPFASKIFHEYREEAGTADRLSRMLYFDTKLWLADDLLARGDKTSMGVSLEARVPLLDHKLVEFAASLPSNMKVRFLMRKYLLKKVARKVLPGRIVDRKKEGFPIPLSLWFKKECRGFVRDLLSAETVKRRGLFNPSYIRLLIDEHEAGAADHAQPLWGLISVELWHRMFLDSRSSVMRFHADSRASI